MMSQGGFDFPDRENDDCNLPLDRVPDFVLNHRLPADLLELFPGLSPPEDLR
jgi:hypothetical protein